MMWYIVVMASLFYVTVALPFGLFYSETDEEKEFVSFNAFFVLLTFLIKQTNDMLALSLM